MQRRPVLSVLLLSLLALPAAASSPIVPRLLPLPLSMLVQESRQVLVLQVEAVKEKEITLKTIAVLKGNGQEVPFRHSFCCQMGG